MATILPPISSPKVIETGPCRCAWSRAQEEVSVMSRLAIAFVLTLGATAPVASVP